MATAILALFTFVLGIVSLALAGTIWFIHKEYPVIMAALEAAESRIAFLEKRKSVIAEAVASQPKPAGVGASRPRSASDLRNTLEALEG